MESSEFSYIHCWAVKCWAIIFNRFTSFVMVGVANEELDMNVCSSKDNCCDSCETTGVM